MQIRATPRTLFVLSLLPCLFVPLAVGEDGWRNLKDIRRDRGYTVATRKGWCISGRLIEVRDGLVKLESVPVSANGIPEPKVILTTVNRSDVLRVSDNSTSTAHDTIYSGRSSWADVQDAHAQAPAEWLKIVTKNDGRVRKCKNAEVFEDRITCGSETVFKGNIDRVYYVRLKPASDSQLYLSHEGTAWLDAKTWFNYALYGRIEVLLYESGTPEQNTPVACRVAPRLSAPKR